MFAVFMNLRFDILMLKSVFTQETLLFVERERKISEGSRTNLNDPRLTLI